ncbi:hypothetical protein TNCV_124071 [Trichonephila clavipes]|nr:hypothetical protein TNCV_124071 [Trichonephila clavipes]
MLHQTSGSGSVAITITRSQTIGFLPYGGPSQGIGVSRRSDCTNKLSGSSAGCLSFGGPRGAATCPLTRSTKPPSICSMDSKCLYKSVQIQLLMYLIRLPGHTLLFVFSR